MKFIADEEQAVTGGVYNFQATTNGGAVSLAMKLTGASEFVPVTGGAFTADETNIITLSTCIMKAGLIGGAEFVMNKV